MTQKSPLGIEDFNSFGYTVFVKALALLANSGLSVVFLKLPD
jgi:hypothetical protein